MVSILNLTETAQHVLTAKQSIEGLSEAKSPVQFQGRLSLIKVTGERATLLPKAVHQLKLLPTVDNHFDTLQQTKV